MSRASPRAPKNDATEDSAEPDRQFVTALARGLDILRCFSAERRMLGTTELAHLTGLAQPTVWRLCHTLQKTGFLAAVPGKDKLQLGIAAIALGGAALAGQEALDIIRPMLQALADRYQVAVALGRRDGDSIVYLLRCQGNSPLLMNLRVGSRIPLFHSAIGWAYLACCSPEEREALLQEARASGKAGDATEQQAIADAIARYPERGFVYHERPAYQINTVAAAIELPAGERYVVSCGGPAALLPRQLMLDEAGPTLRQLAHELQPILLMGEARVTQPLAPAIPQRWPTRITELMGIRWPLLLGGMMWLSDARLVAAMVRAGGMGFMTARSSRTDQDFRQALRDCGELTGGLPFGVNLTLSRRAANNESMLTRLRIALDAGVRLFETAGLPPTPLLPALREAGAIVIHKCAHVRHAVAAQNMGVDAVTLVGMEEGGHPGSNQLPTFLNGAYALEQLRIPLALGGGIGHGRQIAAALALGADAVVMGSVFTPAQETPAHAAYKQRVVDTSEHGTRAVLGSLGDTWRILDNENARKVAALEQAGASSYADFGELISGERTQALAYQAGQHEEGMLSMGPAVGFARGIEPVESIVLRLQRECVQASARFMRMVDSA